MFKNDLDEAISYHERGNYDLAFQKYMALLDRKPHHPHALYYAGTCALNMGRNGLAINLLQAAITLKPGFYDAMCNLGCAYRNELHNDRAEQVWLEAIKHRKEAGIYSNLGGLHINAGRPEKALYWYDKALEIDPKDSHTRSNRALILLEMGRWKEGWGEYEAGVDLGSRRAKVYPGVEKWDGGKNETVIVLGEQGIGDEIMFGSMVPDLVQISKKVVWDCHPRLETLLKRSFPTVDVRPTRKSPDGTWAKEYPGAKWVHIGSLGRWFRPTAESFPKKPYLVAEPQKFKGIGLAWAGGTKRTNAKERSLDLTQMRPILEPGRTYYSLQYTPDAAREVCQFEGDTGIGIKHWPKYVECFDYDLTAGFVAGLDMVVSVCTTVTHLAGALGTKCLCLTPKQVAWRYGQTGDQTPWYGSVKAIRQEKDGDWGPVLETARREIVTVA